MAFNCTYRSLNEHNIRHIYSDQKLRIIFPKRTHFRSLQEELPVPPLRLYPKKFYDYYPAYNIGIPRAPAFRGTDPQHIDEIVKRICKPMRCGKERRHGYGRKTRTGGGDVGQDGEGGGGGGEQPEAEDDDNNNNNNNGDSPRDSEQGRESSSRKMTPKDMDALLLRLQRPTESWEKKKYDRDERERERQSKESTIPKLPPIPSRV